MFHSFCNWIVFVTVLYMLLKNEYMLRTGKKENDTREKKVFRYFIWISTIGSLILALIR